MVGKTATLTAAAVLVSSAEASPFFKWNPWGGYTRAPGYGAPTGYGIQPPEYTVPAWPWWPNYPGYTTTKATTTSLSTAPVSYAASSPATSTKPFATSISSKSIASSGVVGSSVRPSSSALPSSSTRSSSTVVIVTPSSTKTGSLSFSASTNPASASGSASTRLPPVSASSSINTRSASATPTASASVSQSKVSACSKKSRTRKSASASASINTKSAIASIGTSKSSPSSIVSSGVPYPSTIVSRSRASGSAVSTGILPSGTASSPCGRVAQLAASQTGKATPTVPAQLGYDCLNSIPFHQKEAVSYLDSIRPFLEWQSTTEYLKNPPAEYAAKVQPPYDFLANFDRIYNQAKAGDYANEYQFGFDVYRAFQRAHDGHFVIYPSSVTTLITFGRLTPLVSVSLDGVSVPEVYVYSDILAASFSNSTFKPSPLTTINGRNSTEFLLDFSQNGSLQDRDALWNNVFYELAQVALGASGTGTGTFSGSGRGRLIYPGPVTTLTFANGTSNSYDNFARVLKSFAGVTDGVSLYNKYLALPKGEPQGALQLATSTTSGAPSAAASSSRVSLSRTLSSARAPSSAASATATAVTGIPAPGYPTNPVTRERNNLNAGYFLEGAGYDDVAVLAVNSFVGTDADELDFQAVNTYLIDQAVKYNKTKLIVDVSANGGGTILQGYDLFKQLFPKIEPFELQRTRAHEANNIFGQEFSAYSERVPRTLSANATALDIVSSFWNYQTDLDSDLKPFTSWAQKYGPDATGPSGDQYTTPFRWNLSDVLTPINSGGIYVSGYQNRSNITTQPFKAENIVVVTDGYCASTCTIFSELMRQQANVKYVALGGRPNKDIIQAVGGVKGTNDLPYDYILGVAEQVFAEPLVHTREYYNQTVLNQYNDQVLLQSSASVVNFRDGVRKGETTPLQFVYEPADCRIYYTPEMTIDITAAWKAVADTAFNGKNRCVAGSLGGYGVMQKRSVEAPKQHSAHEKRMLFDSVASIDMGQGSIVRGADSIMII